MKTFKINNTIGPFPKDCIIFVDERSAAFCGNWCVYLSGDIPTLLRYQKDNTPDMEYVGKVVNYSTDDLGFSSKKKFIFTPRPKSINISDTVEHSS